MACPTCKKKQCTCEKGEKGDIGLTGPKGDKGDKGDIPSHEWNGTQIRFENPDGSWGPWVDLQGPAGPCCDGEQGIQGIQGVAGPQGKQGNPGVAGPEGERGADGVSVANVGIDAAGDLIVRLSDGNEINAGSVLQASAATPAGPNEKAFIFRARNTTDQKHTGGAVTGTIVAFQDDKSDGYYDYGGAWSGNDFLNDTTVDPTVRFHVDQLSVNNNDGVAQNVTIDFEHIPGATGVPVIRGTQTINIPAGGNGVFSFQSTDITINQGDRARVVMRSAAVDADIQSGGEFWNVEV